MSAEWFRSPAWGPEDRAEFERRLARARAANRGQYLRIKGLALREAGSFDGARELWLRVLDDPGYVIQRWSAMEHLAELAVGEDPDQGEQLYRQLLAEDPTLNATTNMAEVRLAALLTQRATPEALAEAHNLLLAWKARRGSPFPMDNFEWEITLARWGDAVRDPNVTRDASRRALALADAPAPFSRHPGVGRVRADADVIGWLRRKADGSTALPSAPKRGIRGLKRRR